MRSVYLLWLSFTTGNDDVQSVDFVDLEFVILDSLVKGGLVDDAVVAVKKMLLEFVGEDTFNWVAFVALGDFANDFSNLIKNYV